MSAQMSAPMMSTPSWASRTACARPWPRATPVMNATRPSRDPVMRTPLSDGYRYSDEQVGDSARTLSRWPQAPCRAKPALGNGDDHRDVRRDERMASEVPRGDLPTGPRG